MALRHGKYRTFSQGTDLRGPLALGVTHREGGARASWRRPRGPFVVGGGEDSIEVQPPNVLTADGAVLLVEAVSEGEVVDRALRLVALLREAADVRAPAGVPCEGKVVSFDNALRFVARYRRFVKDIGDEAACPRITFHWTAEENFQSIVESNLKVPNREAGIKQRHGAAFGRGIYTCPDFKMAKEDFSYGASATFVCLVLVGRQLTRHHGKGHGLSECRGEDFDSVLGRLPSRYCGTWVLPESDQILPCFLIDEVAISAALEKLREAIALLREPWPAESKRESLVPAGVESEVAVSDLPDDTEPEQEQAGVLDEASSSELGVAAQYVTIGDMDPVSAADSTRWRRRCERGVSSRTPDAKSPPSPSDMEVGDSDALPYGGDISAAMRAQDRPALKRLFAARDRVALVSPVRSVERSDYSDAVLGAFDLASQTSTSTSGRRWGGKLGSCQAHQVESSPCGSVVLPHQLNRGTAGTLIEQGGNLLDACEDFLVHQCNCVFGGKAQGLAEGVFDAFPDADVYSQRASRGRSHDLPGSVSVHRRVVNLYGQLLPGRPADEAPLGGWPGFPRYVGSAQAADDTLANRLRWFEDCLRVLPRALPDHARSVAFPARIGCGLAGGTWARHLEALRRFARAHPEWRIVIYDVDKPVAAISDLASSPSPSAATVASIATPSKTSSSRPIGGIWASALFEALRGCRWIAYGEEEQAALRAALQHGDDCLEALVDAERRAALAELSDASVMVSGRSGGSHGAVLAPTVGPTVHLRCSANPMEVSLANIASSAGFGQERRKGDSAGEHLGQDLGEEGDAVLVRLRLPAVREGELRLPADLDDGGVAPAPHECGRLIEAVGELEALARASGHCGICLGDLHPRKRSGAVVQLVCGHPFHDNCLVRWFEERQRCPTCKRRFGHLMGNQPAIGCFSWRLESSQRLAGCPDSFTIVLNFRFPPGRDMDGQPYRGRSQTAYLPHDDRGKLVLSLFQLAFRRRVLFDLRISASDSKYWPAFNIHLKTAISGGPERFGYPDDDYFHRVMAELRENGVTVADLK